MDWTGRTVVVTGASTGIGRAIAETLGARGAPLALCAREPAKLEAVAGMLRRGGGRVLALPCDVREEQPVQKFAERVLRELGVPWVLVNNAGLGRFKPVVDTSPEDYDAMMETNVRGVFLMTRVFLPAMLEAGRGDIVNIASLAGKNAVKDGAVYAASKHAVLGFSKSLMLEVRQRGLRVIAVCPGSVDTSFFTDEGGIQPKRERVLTPADVAHAVLSALEADPRAMISELDIRPSNP